MKKLFIVATEGFTGRVLNADNMGEFVSGNELVEDIQDLVWEAMQKEFITGLSGKFEADVADTLNKEVIRILNDAANEALEAGDLEERHVFGLGEECAGYVTDKFYAAKEASMNRTGEKSSVATATKAKGQTKTQKETKTMKNAQTTTKGQQQTKGAEVKMEKQIGVAVSNGEVVVGGKAFNKKYGEFTVVGSEGSEYGQLVLGAAHVEGEIVEVKLMATAVSATPIEESKGETVVIETKPSVVSSDIAALKAQMDAMKGKASTPVVDNKPPFDTEEKEETSEERTEREAKELIAKQVSKEADKEMVKVSIKGMDTNGLFAAAAKLGIKAPVKKEEKAKSASTSARKSAAAEKKDQPQTEKKGGNTVNPTTSARKSAAGASQPTSARTNKGSVRLNAGAATAQETPNYDRNNMKVNFSKAVNGRAARTQFTFDASAPWYINTMNRVDEIVHPEAMEAAGWVNEGLGIQGVEFVDISAIMPSALGAVEIKLDKITLEFRIFESRQADSREPVFSPNAGYTKEEYTNYAGEAKNRYVRHYQVSQFAGKDENNRNTYEDVVVPLGAFGIQYKDIDSIVAQAMVIAHWAFGFEV